MRINKITLNNIRSYKDQEIEFPEGTVLLSGDIGSGKTSVLLGIEFALFGLQPGQKGSSILRNGEDQGGVSIEFEIDGKTVLIERTLKRGRSISQDYCAITIDGEKEEISVMELKNKVLELLNYPREFAKKQNLLYKFTVYTPQEEMKQIILQDAETRINTLRHVFGIDKYKRILENVSIVSSKLREERRIKESLTSELEKNKEELLSKEEEFEAKTYNLVSVEKEHFLKKEERKRLEEESEEINEKINEKNKLSQEIEKTKLVTSNKNNSILDNLKTINAIKIQISEIKTTEFEEGKIEKLRAEIEELKLKREKISEDNLEITARITSLNIKNSENESLKKRLAHIEICPTCLQNVSAVYSTNVTNKLESDIIKNVREIEDLTLKKQILSKNLNENEFEISKREREVNDLKLLKIKLEGIKERKTRIEEIEKNNSSLEKDIELLNRHIEALKASVFELSKYDKVYESKKSELDNAFREERLAEIKVAELKKEIEVFSGHLDELKERIKKTESIKSELNYLIKLENWLSKTFVSIISFIEKNVMVKLQSQFSRLFSEWFAMLVPDNFSVRLTDDFSPIIEYADYEMEYAQLSGGERTAIALAYRLALNQVINSVMSKIKTKDLIILDEPTDGFSEQQLDKMRDVLYQLDAGQMIIVSHEQKIEGFVENLIRFKKIEGISGRENQ